MYLSSLCSTIFHSNTAQYTGFSRYNPMVFCWICAYGFSLFPLAANGIRLSSTRNRTTFLPSPLSLPVDWSIIESAAGQ